MSYPPPNEEPPPYPEAGKGMEGQAYPPPQGYPPQQGGYPPQQAGYPPPGQPPAGAYPPPGQPPAGVYPPPGQPPAGAYPPPTGPGYQQGGYPAQHQPHGQSTVIVAQPTTTVTTVVQHFGDCSASTKCPNCQNQVTTQVTHEAGTMAWLICILLFIFGFWLCCCIPFCVDGMQNAIHTCPVCKYRIATYNR